MTFVTCCVCSGIAGVLVMADFGSHMLVVFISNFGFYMIYYIIVKVHTHTHMHTNTHPPTPMHACTHTHAHTHTYTHTHTQLTCKYLRDVSLGKPVPMHSLTDDTARVATVPHGRLLRHCFCVLDPSHLLLHTARD